MGNILQKIKQGKNNYKIIKFPGTEEKVALVILSSNELMNARLRAEDYIEENKIEQPDLQELVRQQFVIYSALRDKDDRNQKVADSLDEFRELIDVEETQYLMVEYTLLTTESSPFVGAVEEEQFEQLKKTLEKIKLKDLNGMSLVALRNFLMTLVSKN